MFVDGSEIGAYRIRRRLGRGGTGEVYLAEPRNGGRRAAIKVIRLELSTDDETVARFLSEARAASRLKHPGMVEVIDCKRHTNGQAYVVRELLEGESLGDYLDAAGTVDVRSAIGIAGLVAGALGAAHAKGITHGDLKPDNVFLTWSERAGASRSVGVKVLDFGVAGLANGRASGAAGANGRGTQTAATSSVLWMPHYLSPEQCGNPGPVDHRADIYALGCILFELVSGRPPFVRKTADDLVAAHRIEAPPSLAAEGLPAALDALVAHMLAKSPAARPQTMAEVVSALEQQACVRAVGFPTLVRRPSPLADVGAHYDDAGSGEERRPGRDAGGGAPAPDRAQRRVRSAVIAAALLLASTAAGLLLLRDHPSHSGGRASASRSMSQLGKAP